MTATKLKKRGTHHYLSQSKQSAQNDVLKMIAENLVEESVIIDELIENIADEVSDMEYYDEDVLASNTARVNRVLPKILNDDKFIGDLFGSISKDNFKRYLSALYVEEKRAIIGYMFMTLKFQEALVNDFMN